MYSVVLVAALTSGTATPDWHHRGWGCYGGGGGGYTGCYGCWGGCYGGWGGYGGGFGPGCYGASFVWTCAASYGGWYGNGCWGRGWPGVGCWSTYGMPYAGIPSTPVLPGGVVPGTGITTPEAVQPPKSNQEVSERGRLVVELPEDARLYIDDQPMKTQSQRRVFQTPPLRAGQTYYYVLRAEVTRNGQTQRETVRVLLRLGEEAYATFPTLAPATTTTAQVSR